jgi:hypothetical protein
MVDQDSLAGQRLNEIPHLVDAAEGVKIKKKEHIFLLQDVLALLGMQVPDEDFVGAGQKLKFLRKFGGEKNVHGVPVLFQVVTESKRTPDGVAVGIAVGENGHVLRNNQQLAELGREFHCSGSAGVFRENGHKSTFFIAVLRGCRILFF